MAHRFVAPDNGNGIFWYSFDFGSVHVVQISSEHDWLPGSEQYTWLEQDLQSVNRTQTPWVVLTSHRMMVCESIGLLGA
jgi:phosphodiesterase/alkaline phosphatase D-like protein